MTYKIRLIIVFGSLWLLTAAAGALAGETLSAAETRKLNTFFSNFSEARMARFTPVSLSDEALLSFAMKHNYINNFKSLKQSTDQLSVLVPATLIDRTTTKYFGRTLHAHSGAPYSVLMADGEPLPFSQIRTLTALDDHRYQADGLVYLPGGPDPIDIHANPNIWNKDGVEVETIGRFTAIIKKETTDGGERWILTEYAVIEGTP